MNLVKYFMSLFYYPVIFLLSITIGCEDNCNKTSMITISKISTDCYEFTMEIDTDSCPISSENTEVTIINSEGEDITDNVWRVSPGFTKPGTIVFDDVPSGKYKVKILFAYVSGAFAKYPITKNVTIEECWTCEFISEFEPSSDCYDIIVDVDSACVVSFEDTEVAIIKSDDEDIHRISGGCGENINFIYFDDEDITDTLTRINSEKGFQGTITFQGVPAGTYAVCVLHAYEAGYFSGWGLIKTVTVEECFDDNET